MNAGNILIAEKEGLFVLKFVGDVRLTLCQGLDEFVTSIGEKSHCNNIIIDLTDTQNIDSTSLGLLAKLSKETQSKHHFCPTVVSTNDDITRIIVKMGFKHIFTIVSDSSPCSDLNEMSELTATSPCLSESQMGKTVLEAHKVLMELNEDNKQCFISLVGALEKGLHEPPSVNNHQYPDNAPHSNDKNYRTKHRPPNAA